MWKRIICWGLVIIWLGIIFSFSAKNGNKSTNESKDLVIGFLAEGTVAAQKLGIINRNLSQEEMDMILDNLNIVVRKLAHATIYLVLAILLLFAFHTKQETFLRNMLIVIFLCFLYSITDEYHQTFVAGRKGLFSDCIIDTIGAGIGCVIYSLFLRLKAKEKQQK